MPFIPYFVRVLRFLFSIDELPSELVTTETSAYYCLDGSLCLDQGTDLVFEECGVLLVEFAVWLSGWWKSNQPALSYTPEGSDPNYGPMLLLASAGETSHRLTYPWENTLANWTAEQAEWEDAVTQFREALRKVVLERYRLRLDRLLPPF